MQYIDFWKSVEKPTLKKFLDFRLKEGCLEDKTTEHNRYKSELKTIGEYYCETSEIGTKLINWTRSFKAS